MNPLRTFFRSPCRWQLMYAQLLRERFGSPHGVPFVNCGEPAVVCLDFTCLDFIYLSACVAGSYQPELLVKYPFPITINPPFIGDYPHPCLFTTMSGLKLAGIQWRCTSVDVDGPSLNGGGFRQECFHSPGCKAKSLKKLEGILSP